MRFAFVCIVLLIAIESSLRALYKTEKNHLLSAVYSLAFSPDGKLLATGGSQKLVLWRVTPVGKAD